MNTKHISAVINTIKTKNKSYNPIAYGILRLSQLRAWDFYLTPQKTMLRLLD